ncbi:MAG TPA: hydroxymethylbilane synthase [Acidiferrobacteraceae bacterium]|nr:hydroxymethylbilane synthase [Acidiferrobacteraceae bacterium]
MDSIRIGTRKSPLALWQAEHVRDLLRQHFPRLEVLLMPMTTQGDRRLDVTLGEIGGKGLFTKELEQALLEHHVDIAVHSMKDVTVELPAGLMIGAMLERADARDAFVSRRYAHLDQLPEDSRVGTASLRRQSQIRHRWPRVRVVDLRGNVGSRLARLAPDSNEPLDAIILATAGLVRLGLADQVRRVLALDESLPAVGQGAIGVECRSEDREVRACLDALEHAPTRACVDAERAMNLALGGSCRLPIAGYADIVDDKLCLRGLVGDPDGGRIVRAQAEGAPEHAAAIGREVADDLLRGGARTILGRLHERPG